MSITRNDSKAWTVNLAWSSQAVIITDKARVFFLRQFWTSRGYSSREVSPKEMMPWPTETMALPLWDMCFYNLHLWINEILECSFGGFWCAGALWKPWATHPGQSRGPASSKKTWKLPYVTLVVRGWKTLIIIILLTSSVVSPFCKVQVFWRSVQELPFDQTAHFSRSCFHQKVCALYVDIESDEAGRFCGTIPRIGNGTKVGEMNAFCKHVHL